MLLIIGIILCIGFLVITGFILDYADKQSKSGGMIEIMKSMLSEYKNGLITGIVQFWN